ncbi:N-acetylglutaminylglutamine synthetase, partial [Pseudomonas gingeri]
MKAHATAYSQRLLRGQPPSYERLQARLAEDGNEPATRPVVLHCGWGRLLIGHTFADPAGLAEELLNEQSGERDIALYVAAPQQVLAQAPQQLFLDPSDTLRLWFSDYRPATRVFRGFRIRRAQSAEDWRAINQLYIARGMLPIDPQLLTPRHQGGPVYWLAEDEDSGALIGSVMGLNHHKAFHDPEHGCSLWCLAVDPQCSRPGVGEVLVRHLIEHFMSRGLNHLDLSVLHDNRQAKSLYAKLGFRTLSTFAIKRKNGINQPLFLGPGPQAGFNPYARILVEEAHRRGIDVQVDDAAAGMFTLSHGGRRVRCRESLTDLTSAISMSLCQDKSLTHRVLLEAGLNVPSQQRAGTAEDNLAFLQAHGRIVVKPLDGEQGQGVAVDLRNADEVEKAIEAARAFDSRVLLESFHEGLDLRIVVIGFEVVAAAIRHPAQVVGDGHHSIGALIEAQSRRRQAATGGE